MTATAEPPVDPVLERVKTGVEAFDDLVMGGLPRRRTTIVGGTLAAARRCSPRSSLPTASPISMRPECS